MAEEAQDSESPKEEEHDMESEIKGAMRSRVSHFKEQADSLTFEGVRRLLEKDLGLETYALDVHKRLIKQCLQECLDGADDDNASKTSGEMGERGFPRGEVADASDGLQLKKDVNDSEDSPVMGLLTGHKSTKSGTEENEVSGNKDAPSESTIKKAIRKRAPYIKANSEEVTMAGLRRLLEGDLKLEEYTLDPYKKFISQQLDEVLQSHKVSKEKLAVKVEKNVKKSVRSKVSKMVSSEESSDSLDSKGNEEEVEEEREEEEEKEEEEEVKPRKKSIPKGKMQKSDVPKRKKPAKETYVSNKKWRKAGETISEDNSDAEDGHVSEDGHSQSSPEKPVKKKEVSNIAYGKRVENLKSIIKSCAMSVPPSIYKKVKQVPENKREAQLIKELEDILSKEGLSANPSEKEIKEVRRRKERAKELEGIDMSNIVQSSRRRSTISFVAPPKQIPVESEGDDAEDTDKDNNEDEDEDDDDDEEDNEEDEEDDDDSQSEEFNDDGDEDSD